MNNYRVILTTEDKNGIFSWTFQADDAMHALEQYMDDAVLDSDTVVTHIEVRESS